VRIKAIISAVLMIVFFFLCFALCQTELLWIIQPLSVISGGFCGVLCGDKKASRTALCSICVLALFTLTIFIFGRLGAYDFIMLGGKPSEDNYLSASNMGAAGLLLILLYSHSAGGYLFGAAASCLVKKGEEG